MRKEVTREEVKEKLGTVCPYCDHFWECLASKGGLNMKDGCDDFELDLHQDLCYSISCEDCHLYKVGYCEGRK